LGRWLNEEIRMPFEGDHGDFDVEYLDAPEDPWDHDGDAGNW